MDSKNSSPSKIKPSATEYPQFDLLDGSHPWQASVPEGFINYSVKKIENAKVVYFNFALAKEMGLIEGDHEHTLNKILEKKILDTFSIQIINEYDQLHPQKNVNISEGKFMATRYLQLQHMSKRGKTSGDGRSIWNGCLKHKGKTWDVSSRGTGVTALAPGAVTAGKPIPTGCTDYGYSCGQADIDELLGSALMSEIFFQQGINTERTLAIIKTDKNLGIGVRAGTNLLRPAHLFLHLKQGNLSALTAAADYLIERQSQNNEWRFSKGKNKYDQMLEFIASDFAKFAARLDSDYIFVWLEWDGDNVLANAGIIDYGSVRQFGVRHDQYRFDDVERFSTSLNEQKLKAQQIIQTFAQIVDFIKTGRKKTIEQFKDHKSVRKFAQDFEEFRFERLLFRSGFTPKQSQLLLRMHKTKVIEFDRTFKFFERKKIKKPLLKVADGVNRPALYNMRTLLVKLTAHLESRNPTNRDVEILKQAFTEFTSSADRKLTIDDSAKFAELRNMMVELIGLVSLGKSAQKTINEIYQRTQIINREDRITGNGVVFAVEILMKQISSNEPQRQIQKAIDAFISKQILVPEVQTNPFQPFSLRGSSKKVLERIETILRDCKDDI